jgi:molecular chaperone Hsp33
MTKREEQIKKKWAERDRVVKAITRDGHFRAAVVNNTNCIHAAQQRHGLDPVRTLILGRALAGATLMASFLKGEERVVVRADGDGQVRSVYAEALQLGEVRGYSLLNKEPNDTRQSPLGDGILKVQRILYGKQEPVTGIVELHRGDLTSDMGHYLTQSEQIPSAFVIDLAFKNDELVRQSVGLLIQSMPGARPEDIFRVYDTIDYLDRLTEFAERGYSPEEILKQVLPGEIDILGSTPVDFFCRCSMERFKDVLVSLSYEEVNSMEDNGHNELVCQYCGERYYLSHDDFTEMRERMLARRN